MVWPLMAAVATRSDRSLKLGSLASSVVPRMNSLHAAHLIAPCHKRAAEASAAADALHHASPHRVLHLGGLFVLGEVRL